MQLNYLCGDLFHIFHSMSRLRFSFIVYIKCLFLWMFSFYFIYFFSQHVIWAIINLYAVWLHIVRVCCSVCGKRMINVRWCREKDLNKKWIADVDRLRTIINTAITSISDCSTSSESAYLRNKSRAIPITAMEMEIHRALGKKNTYNTYL